jgi:hypothetical protein
MRIAITIRMYPGEQYNTRVYYQHCKVRNSLSKPTLDDSYVERVAYRLKKWYRVKMDLPQFSGQSKGLYEEKFCEGYKAGHCHEAPKIDSLLPGLSSLSLHGI